jgi:hypothetical protein
MRNSVGIGSMAHRPGVARQAVVSESLQKLSPNK